MNFYSLLFLISSATNIEAVADNTLAIKHFEVLGPFLAAPMEGYIDPIQSGQELLKPSQETYPSSLVPGGLVAWKSIQTDSSHIKISHSDANWAFMKNLAGKAITLNQTYVYGEIERTQDEILVISTKQVPELFVNGTRYFGEPYQFSFNRIPVLFQKGTNRVLFKVVTFENPEFDFQISKPEGILGILEDITAPDLPKASLAGKIWLGIPLVNTSNRWLKNIIIKVKEDSVFKEATLKVAAVAPMAILKVPFELNAVRIPTEESKHDLAIEVFAGNSKILEKTISLRVRDPRKSESMSESFISNLDGSVQYYSLIFPNNFNEQKIYDIYLNLHGANVEAFVQTDALAPKDDAFILAPTNRRPHGLAYQDLGRLDVLETLKVFQEKYRQKASKIYLGGHSMGGQGTWHIGLHHPSLFSGLSPSAGWTNLNIYLPAIFQQSEIHMSPSVRHIRDRASLDSNNLHFIENAKGLPIFITQAEQDEIVPPFHSRIFFQKAKNLNFSVKLREVATSDHWFKAPLHQGRGFDSMDNPEQYEFLKKYTAKDIPKSLKFKLVDLSIEQNFYWFRVEKQTRVFDESAFEATINGNKIDIETSNIEMISLDLSPFKIDEKIISISWNGRSTSLSIPNSKKIHLNLMKNKIQNLSQISKGSKSDQHSMKSIFFEPYFIVYGTMGSREETESLLHHARLLSNRIWRTGNGYAPIISDSEITEEILKTYNLIVLGSRSQNKVIMRMAEKLPIQIKNKGVYFKNKKIQTTKTDLSVFFIYPNPENPKKLILSILGTSAIADQVAMDVSPLFDRMGFGLPDYLIFSKEIKKQGWGAVVKTGFFTPDWTYSETE